VAEPLPAPGFPAGVPRPALGFSIDVPDHWVVLDLDPATWDGWVDAFLDRRMAGRRETGRERGPTRAALIDLLRRLHTEDVFLVAVLAAEVDGRLVSASATLAWRRPDLAGDPLLLEGLAHLHLLAPAAPGEDLAARRVEIVELPARGGVKVATRELVALPGDDSRQAWVTQYLVPVLDTGWLAVITTTTGQPELAAAVEDVGDAMAASLHFQGRDPAGPVRPGPAS
jgi:hypothetical protein